MRSKEALEPLFKAWCGVALNEGMTGEGGIVHSNAKNYGMNCAVPRGEFTCKNVVMMELENVEVRAGDAFFFRVECVAHKRDEVWGVRGLADVFTHKNVLDCCEKEKSRERRHKKEKFKKLNKEEKEKR